MQLSTDTLNKQFTIDKKENDEPQNVLENLDDEELDRLLELLEKRKRKKEKDFERSIGKDVDIRLYRAKNGNKEYTGTLCSYDKDTVTIEDGGESFTFERNEIALIRLAFDF